MEIQWQELCERLAALPDPQGFAREHGIDMMTAFSQCDHFPANPEQESMRNALRGLGFEFDDDDYVTITTLSPPIVEDDG